MQFEEDGMGQTPHLLEAALGTPRFPPGGSRETENQDGRQRSRGYGDTMAAEHFGGAIAECGGSGQDRATFEVAVDVGG